MFFCLIYFPDWHLLFPFQDVLDSMWGILRARYLELSSPFLSKSQQDALLQGMAELVSIGKEKLATDPLQQATSKAALRAQLQDHKVRALSRPSPPEGEKLPSDPLDEARSVRLITSPVRTLRWSSNPGSI